MALIAIVLAFDAVLVAGILAYLVWRCRRQQDALVVQIRETAWSPRQEQARTDWMGECWQRC